MTLLVLVRHGYPVVQPGVVAARWELSPDALPALRRLRRSGVLPLRAAWFSSPEPKAVATAETLWTGPITLVDALREAVRPATWYEDDAEFKAVVRRSVLRPHIPVADGWEPAARTQARVLEATRTILAESASDEVVLVGHGTAWTLLVSSLTGEAPDLPAWSGMRLPDVAVLETVPSEPGHLSRRWGAWS